MKKSVIDRVKVSIRKSLPIIGLVCLLSLFMGCGPDGASKQSLTQRKGFDYNAMLINYADNIILPHYKNASLTADELKPAIEEYCTALELSTNNQEQAKLQTAAQNKWHEAMASWQSAELLRIGPMLNNDSQLRHRIYSFATPQHANSCAIDIAVTSINNDDFSVTTRANNARGFDALEYLLFNEDLKHSCNDAVIATQSWNALPEEDRKLARCQLAIAIAEDSAKQINTVEQNWLVSGQNYRSLFINPNNINDHLSQLSDALFYLDKEVKDSKLGLPLAQTTECALQACANTVESRYAKLSAEMIVYNLQAFKKIFNGNDGLGFDDIITFEGFESVSKTLAANIDKALAYAQTLAQQQTVFAAANEQSAIDDGKVACEQASATVDEETQSYCTLHGLIKKITTQMRTDFITIVNVDLPISSQSDND